MVHQTNPEDARHKVLAENTAQAVHKHLVTLVREESRFRSRWVWELLQNARDAAPISGVRVWIISEPNRLVFRHTGLPFKNEDVAHLIYHGSTKHDFSGHGPIGQFGTGFLTTHLLSKKVTVKGQSEDGRRFCFELNRHGDTANDLQKAMEESWDAFRNSLSDGASDLSEYTTEYTYPIEGKLGTLVVEALTDLKANIAYVLAFNETIVSIRMTGPDCETFFRVVTKTNISEPAAHMVVHVEERLINRYVVVMSTEATSAAIEVAQSNGVWEIVRGQNTPRLFVAFPLTATRDFSLPLVVNNENFQPREHRDTLFLKQDQNGNNPNIELLEGAISMAARLAVFAAGRDWIRAASLVSIGELRDSDWLDAGWFRSRLEHRFINPVRSSEILVTLEQHEEHEGGHRKIAPSKSLIPVFSDNDTFRAELWNMASKWKEIASKLPRSNESALWAENLCGWAIFLGKSVDDFEEALTVAKLCERVASCGNLAGIQHELESVDAVTWLNQLHSLIAEMKRPELFDKFALIPSQTGEFRKLKELCRDADIDGDLKDIAESLGVRIRIELMDARIGLNASSDRPARTQEEVLDSAVRKLQAAAKAGQPGQPFRNANVRLFVWLVQRLQLEKLEGFPALTRAAGDADGAIIILRAQSNKEDLPLAPTSCWPEAARKVADFLVPQHHTLSDEYFHHLKDEASWQRLENTGLLQLSPLYVTRKSHMPFIASEPLPEREKKHRHKTKKAVEVSALAFFEKEGSGLDAVRQSKVRATSLLLFLTEYVLEDDPRSLETIEAECDCGEKHCYYRAAWLIPMWENQWVPLGNKKQSLANAEAIVQLFESREDQLRRLTTGNGRLLLEALKISLADLSLRAVAKDEDTRIVLMEALRDIVQATGNDVGKVQVVAKEILESPHLIDDITRRRERREKIQQNHSVGTKVEKLLKELLEEFDFKVERTGIGSDYEVEQDYVEEGHEVLLTIRTPSSSILVEIKSTLGDQARMTVPQAQTADGNKDRFALCVVRLSSRDITLEAVRQGCRFITDIGHRIGPALANYRQYQTTRTVVCSQPGDVELVMTESEVRFAVSADLWDSGMKLDDAVAYFRSLAANPSS